VDSEQWPVNSFFNCPLRTVHCALEIWS
jgi:hypothetical protein